MKKTTNIIPLICLLLSLAVNARGAVTTVAAWNFTTNGLPSLASTRNSSVTGTTSLSISGGAVSSAVSGGNLNLNYTGNHVSDLNGTVLTFAINTTGATFSTFSATYDVGFTAVTALTGTWSYQINGGSFTTLSPAQTITSGANSDTLTGINLASGDALILRYTLSGAAGNNNGQVTFDNFTISADITPVPEPTTIAVSIFGGVFALTAIGRRILKQK